MRRGSILRLSSVSLLDSIIDQGDISKLSRLTDEQTYDLAVEVYKKLKDSFKISRCEQEALNRLKMSIDSNYSSDMHRNNIFKAAHALGIKLPSSMF